MFKRYIAAAIICFLLSSAISFAESEIDTFNASDEIISSETIQLNNGCKLITILYKRNQTRSSVSSYKETRFLDSDDTLLWKVVLEATFTYNGYTSSCTSASSYSRVYEGNWSERDNNTFASGNAAVANVTMVRKILFIVVETQVANLVITCDKDGNTQ